MLVAAVTTSGLTASNTVPVTGASDVRVAFNPGPSVPSQCAGMTFHNTITVTGDYGGSNGHDLIIGGPNGQTLDGGNGHDCIYGAGGSDWLLGSNGNDVLIGGPGFDFCFGGNGNDVYYECEIAF
jgi:Ca2+-binding RTX toxin-like protein